jgi:hypothetical protein
MENVAENTMLAPAYPDEMPLGELRTPEVLLVATLRLFAESAWSHSPKAWWEGLEAANVSAEGVQGLVRLFDIIAVAPRRKLAVACIHCRFLCPDEGLFLQLIASLQRKNVKEASAILLNWVAPAAARMAISHAQSLADELAQQGHLLPRRSAMAGLFPEGSRFPVPAYLH